MSGKEKLIIVCAILLFFYLGVAVKIGWVPAIGIMVAVTAFVVFLKVINSVFRFLREIMK